LVATSGPEVVDTHLDLPLAQQHHQQARLLRRVQHRRGFVGDQQLRSGQQGSGQGYPLQLPAGQLMGPSLQEGPVDGRPTLSRASATWSIR